MKITTNAVSRQSIVAGFLLLSAINLNSQAQIKILFDATKAESAANADWVIDADQHNLGWNPNASVGGGNESNPQRIPTPAQSGITASTPETFWAGSLSYWAVDCVKKGFVVETLPYNGQITYGNSSNAQDLSNYKVYIVDEPNILFTAAQKTAMMNFIQNGGSLFMISDHTVSDRNNDGYDSPAIWNDFISNNSVHNNPFGFSFDLQNFSQTSSNIATLAGDSILHGPMGNVTQVKWSNGTSMTLNPSQNPTVKGVVFQTGASTVGTTSVLCAYARYGCGKVAAIGDSSPPDDGTGDPNDNSLYNGYITDAAGNHQKLLMNITIWLAEGACSNSTGINTLPEDNDFLMYPNPSSDVLHIKFTGGAERKIFFTDISGRNLDLPARAEQTAEGKLYSIETNELVKGIYFCTIVSANKTIVEKLVISR